MRFVIKGKEEAPWTGAIAGLLWFLFVGTMMGREIPSSLLPNHPAYYLIIPDRLINPGQVLTTRVGMSSKGH